MHSYETGIIISIKLVHQTTLVIIIDGHCWYYMIQNC